MLFGFGDRNRVGTGDDVILGTNHMPDWRDVNYIDHLFDQTNKFVQGPIIRGWKYGVQNGLPEYSKAYFRRGRFGQLRDMLEQRPMAKFFNVAEKGSNVSGRGASAVGGGVLTVKFVDAAGNVTAPENTTSSNLNHEATSSCPFFDGVIANRPPITPETQNSAILTLEANEFGVTTVGGGGLTRAGPTLTAGAATTRIIS
jgi:hypothetical protein